MHRRSSTLSNRLPAIFRFQRTPKGIEFEGSRPEMITRSPRTLNALKEEMTAALATAGYSPVAAAEGSPAAPRPHAECQTRLTSSKRGLSRFCWFLRHRNRATRWSTCVAFLRRTCGRTQPKLEKAEVETGDTTTEGQAKGSDQFDAMMSGILGKVKEATEQAIEGKPANLDLDALMGAVKGKPKANAPEHVEKSAAESASVEPAAKEEVTTLEVEEANGLPFPNLTPRKLQPRPASAAEVQTTVSANVDRVLAFYRTELGKKGLDKDSTKTQSTPGKASLVFTTPDARQLWRFPRQLPEHHPISSCVSRRRPRFVV